MMHEVVAAPAELISSIATGINELCTNCSFSSHMIHDSLFECNSDGALIFHTQLLASPEMNLSEVFHLTKEWVESVVFQLPTCSQGMCTNVSTTQETSIPLTTGGEQEQTNRPMQSSQPMQASAPVTQMMISSTSSEGAQTDQSSQPTQASAPMTQTMMPSTSSKRLQTDQSTQSSQTTLTPAQNSISVIQIPITKSGDPQPTRAESPSLAEARQGAVAHRAKVQHTVSVCIVIFVVTILT